MSKSLSKLAAKPQLMKIELDTPDIIEKYGESLEFYVYDRQPMDLFVQIATKLNSDYSGAVLMINDLILDEKGKPVCGGGLVLPPDVTSAAIQKVIEQLGK